MPTRAVRSQEPAPPKSVLLTVRVPPDVPEKLQSMAEAAGLPQGGLLAIALDHESERADYQEVVAATRAWNEAWARIKPRVDRRIRKAAARRRTRSRAS